MSRVSFSSGISLSDYPNFLDIQLRSFKEFLSLEVPPEQRKEKGIYKAFQEYFPVKDSRENYKLEVIDYTVDPPRNTIVECVEKGLTYAVSLRVKLRLSSLDKENTDFDTIEQEAFLGAVPYMTPSGSFIINGSERVIVSQLHRSPGVFFSQTKHPSGAKLYLARIIPFNGSWMEFSNDINNVVYAYIDRKKKFPVTTLLRVIGYPTDRDILHLFGLCDEVEAKKSALEKVLGRRLAARVLKTWVEEFADEETGETVTVDRTEVLLERDTAIEAAHIPVILSAGIDTVVLHKEGINPGEYATVYNTLHKDDANSEKEALYQIYHQLRNVEPPDEQTASEVINDLFFSEKRYDLGDIGRYKINKKLKSDVPMSIRVLTPNDIIGIVKHLIELVNSKAEVDDIDHLSNRRVRTVGEQLYAQFMLGLSRMARVVRERMNVRDNEDFKPLDLINAKTLVSVVNTFFWSSQLSQFMDQTNPLAEITHKRRISALGPGGLSRERAGFEVRDVHYTHYGRLCTIETPEGPNIGLISSLCVHARINGMGFIETPYRCVKRGKLSREVDYLTAEEEDHNYIAQANAAVDDKGKFLEPLVKARYQGDFPLVEPEKLNYVDLDTNQIVSVAASLIPFLEHDDANRALMGSNMQRQAVALLKPEAPIVGTGMEGKVVEDSNVLTTAKGDGKVVYVDAEKIVVESFHDDLSRTLSFSEDCLTYYLSKFRRTNQDTCMNQRPIVQKGDRVRRGQILSEGFCTAQGELALGANLKVVFMPWRGYNFEDAILISERVVREDVFTSIHVEEFSLEVRDIKHGKEEFTSEIPNIGEEALHHLDEHGIVRTGSHVRESDILIGKITPKGQTDPTPEEKLLRAIFGDKAGDVRDVSLRTPPSFKGVVIDTKLFSRPKHSKESRQRARKEVEMLNAKYRGKLLALKERMLDKLCVLLDGKKSVGVSHKFGEKIIGKGQMFTRKNMETAFFQKKSTYTTEKVAESSSVLDIFDDVLHGWTDDADINEQLGMLVANYLEARGFILGAFKREKFSVEVGDELPIGVVQLAKVYVAKKRKLQVGDKMAGRHGNKGVIAKIVSQEDMPFLADGSPVDIVLNPLGVPSRMNIGQIYETVLGWAGLKLGKKYASPIFSGFTLDDVAGELKKAGLPSFGRTWVYDGRTGDRFDRQVTVGVIYMMKLGHLVDDKMHARSIGPYSLITQQPLGGKSQFGGQRFGEMEVWALEAFGAANILREMLTIKSDDVVGRARTYEAIVKGETIPEPGTPESFNVLVHELRGLGLSVDLK